MTFEKEYYEKKERFENYLNSLVGGFRDIPEPLYSAITYSLVGNSGKRLRPILFLAAAQLFVAEETESLLKTACAIECLHTYSLIHDDLPCMDNSDTRRGKPSNHKVYGEDVAVLAGDALLNMAYELLLDAVTLCENTSKHNYIRAAKLISELAGSRGLIAGQVVDTAVDTEKHVSARLNYIYQHKTADLITASLLSGAVVGGASEADIGKIREAGDNIGYVFQIMDDLIDFESGEDEGKNTFVHIYGVKEAKRAVSDRTAMAMTQLSALNGDTSFLRLLVKNLSIRKN